ncbi:MAG: hypothetical protein JJ896_09650 [Rhodothermales bacterium]|nr:hypothetical protein [Rhodothermales bacterium]MBO6779903.1 hypothetical protein [Rhodothermales bacterium]
MLRSVTAAYSYMGLFFAFAMAGLLSLFMRKNRGGFNLAEQFVFSLFVIGHWTLFTGLILPITFRISPILHSTIGIGGYFVLFAVASLGFHQEGAKGVLKTSLCLAIAFLAYFIILAIVMMIFVILATLDAAGG